MDKIQTYLGDGVYAEFRSYGDVILTTSNDLSETNRIVLEPKIMNRLEAAWNNFKEHHSIQ